MNSSRDRSMWSDGRLQALDDGSRGVASQVLLGLRLFLVAIWVMGAYSTSPVLLSFSRGTSDSCIELS